MKRSNMAPVVPAVLTTMSLAIIAALVALFAAGILAPTSKAAVTNTSVLGTADTQIDQSRPDQNYGSATSIGADGDVGRGADASALIKWNLSGIGSGTKVVSASVTLNVTDSSTQTYKAYRLNRAWVESAATWKLYDSSKPWQIAGAMGTLDRDATVVGTITPSAKGKQTFALSPAVVQGWVDNPASNQGIIIADAANTNGFDFSSRESSTSSQPPTLTVTLDSGDTTPPDTVIDSGPSGTVNTNSASFAFSSTESGSSFACSLDGAAFSSCAPPKGYSTVADGSHTFRVQAIDTAGNTDATPAERTWTVDTTAPTIGAVEPADGSTGVAAASDILVTFSEAMDTSTISGSTYTLVKQNADGTTASVAATVTYDPAAKRATLNPNADLEAGVTYSATVKGGTTGVRDTAGNSLAADKTWSFTTAIAPPTDTTPPDTTIDSGPSGTVNSDSATFAFSSTEPGSSFACRLDGATFSACSSPQSYSGLIKGAHTFEVRATDPAGNADPTLASRTWTVDTTPTQSNAVLTAVADTEIIENTPDQNNGTATTTLRVDGDDPSGSGKDLSSLVRWNLSSIAPGTQVSSASITLTVSTNTSPQTYGIYQLKRAWAESAATWNVYDSGNPWEAVGAKGSLDRNPTVVGTMTPSASGKLTFALPLTVVQGWVDNPMSNQGLIVADATNTDGFGFYSRESTDSSRRPQLSLNLGPDTAPPETTIDSGPSSTTNVGSAKFAFSSSEVGSAFECSLDGGVFSTCGSPKEYTRLADGSHAFQVWAIDPSGNTDPTPANRTWTVDTSSVQGDPVLVGAGDIAGGANDNDEATAELIRYIPGTIFTLGDNVYESGNLAEYGSYYDPTWGTEKARTKPSPGNHEYTGGTTKQYGTGYFDYFGAVAARENAGSYSYDLGDWHIISLNTGQCYGTPEADGSIPRCGPGDPMLIWLESDLGANQKSCTLAYFHHPRWSSGSSHGSQPAYTQAIWDMLYAYNADVVVSAHDHDYERFAPQEPNGNRDDARGIREFVVGTGGESHSGFGTILPNSEVRNSDTYGVIKLTLHPGSYDWQFVPVAGKTFTDVGTASCH